MTVSAVLVHGIRTSRTMWRAQLAHLDALEVPSVAVDLPGHGTRIGEEFTLAGALGTIDEAVRAAAEDGLVLLVGHSMGGLLSTAYAGARVRPRWQGSSGRRARHSPAAVP